MKNLKRVLSLGLASVMLLGMMVVGAGAADFTDADDIEHQEAVDVLAALGVVKGKEDGSYFDPKGTVTRAEMAKMIAITMQGGTDVASGVKGTPSYSDIQGHWAEQYIEYCTDLGIISGRGDGTFDPEGEVTGIEVTKMVLTAMGYDADAYKLKGAGWASRTDEEARKAYPRSLYDSITGVTMNAAATRDTAAQLIWNGLQSNVVTVEPKSDQMSSGLEWGYKTGKDNPTLLMQRYSGEVWIGTYEGNHDTGAAKTEKGEIAVSGGLTTTDADKRNGWAAFPSDMSIENIGEEVKVVFKDGTNTEASDEPDAKDVIYGVFNTGATTVYKCIMDDTDKNKDKQGKIEINDVLYDVSEGGAAVYVNYITDSPAYIAPASSSSNNTTGYALASYVSSSSNFSKGDEMKFVCDSSNGKITKVYVDCKTITKVTGVSGGNVSLDGVGSISIEDNDIYADIAKDDVVVYSRWYDDDDKDEALFTVEKAESVDGVLTGYNRSDVSSNTTSKVVVDGKGYSVHGTLKNVTEDSASKYEITDDNIDDDVIVYLVNGFAGAVDIPETTTTSYAVVTGFNMVDTGTPTTIDATYDAMNVKILMSDGTTDKYDVHKDSTWTEKTSTNPNVNYKIKGHATADASNVLFAASQTSASGDGLDGTLVKYTTASGSVKIKDVATAGATKTDWTKNVGYQAVGEATTTAPNGGVASIPALHKIYNKDTKSLIISDDGTNTKSLVASTDAVLFVYVDGSVDKYYAYNMRSLGNVYATAEGSTVQYYTKNGMAVAAFVTLHSRPGGGAQGTLYGIVTNVDEIYTVNKDTYRKARVWTGEEKTVVYYSELDDLAKGMIVRFEESSDALYEDGDIDILDTRGSMDKTTLHYPYTFNTYFKNLALSTGDRAIPVAIDDYNSGKGLLKYFTGTTWDASTKSYVGVNAQSATVDGDVVIVNVNGNDPGKTDSSRSVNSFDSTTGYANAVICLDEDGIVTAIIVETSQKANLDATMGSPLGDDDDDDEEVENGVKTSGGEISSPFVSLNDMKETPGVYTISEEATNLLDDLKTDKGGVSGPAANQVLIVYTLTENGTTGLRVTNSDGDTVYEEYYKTDRNTKDEKCTILFTTQPDSPDATPAGDGNFGYGLYGRWSSKTDFDNQSGTKNPNRHNAWPAGTYTAVVWQAQGAKGEVELLKETITVAGPTSTATKDKTTTSLTAFDSKDAGVYQPTADNSSLKSDLSGRSMSGEIQDQVIAVFQTTANSQVVAIVVKNAKGEVVYEESKTGPSTAGGCHFWITTKPTDGNHGNAGWGTYGKYEDYAKKTSNTLKPAGEQGPAWASGTYSYTVYGSVTYDANGVMTAGNVISNGAFTVK